MRAMGGAACLVRRVLALREEAWREGLCAGHVFPRGENSPEKAIHRPVRAELLRYVIHFRSKVKTRPRRVVGVRLSCSVARRQ